MPTTPPAASPATPAAPLALDRRRLLVGAGLAAPLVALPGLLDGAQAAPQLDMGVAARKPRRVPSARVLTTSGLYSYPQDYLRNREQMRGLGARTLRLSDADMDDATWAAMAEDAYDAHITVSTADRAEFATEAAWIADHLARLDAVLSRWPFRWVEIWNEPNFFMWSDASPEQKQVAYGNLLVAAYRFVKTRYPATGVIGFAAGGSSAAAPLFVEGVLAAVPEAASSFDVLSMHPYIAPVAPEETKHEEWGSWNVAGQVRAVRSLGVRTPIWFSEIGWEIGQDDGGTYARESVYTVSAEQQAAYTARMFVLAMRLGVERMHHMYVIDTDNYNGGFFSPDGPRPQAAAMAFQQRALVAPTAIRRVGDNRSDLHAYRIRTANGPVTMAWSEDRRRLQVGRRATVRDLYGNRVRTRRGQVELSGSPVYVTGA